MPSALPDPEIVHHLPRLAPRAADSHKGDFGRVLVIAGSRGMSGAAILCASAALRGGAGLVRLAVPAGIQAIVATANPCYTTAALPCDDTGRITDAAEVELIDLVRDNDVAAAGPGLGQSHCITAVVLALLKIAAGPIVLDADAVNALHGHLDQLTTATGPLVLTPHPGEFARLLGTTTAAVQARRQELAVRFAAERRVVLVLKGHGTLVTDGRRLYRNTTGNPGMATGGTGDVLTGLIAALLGQGLKPFEAAQLGVYLHGLAGDLGRNVLGEVSLTAADLLDYVPRAFLSLPRDGPGSGT
jgi:ADP-dependent NAD(P)H-hydrate dehydratase